MTAGDVLRRAVAADRWSVLAAAVLLMAWQVCEALVPVVVGAAIDRAVAPHDGRAILLWLGVLGVLFLVLSLSFRFGARTAKAAAERAANRTRLAVAGAALDPRTRPDPERRTGTLVSIASGDADRVGEFLSVVPRTCSALAAVLVVAVALLRISVPLGLLVLLGAPPLLFAVQRLGGPLERRSGVEQARAAEAADLATDLVTGLRVLKGFGGERAAADRYRAASRRSLRATLRAARAEAVYSGATLLLTLCFVALVALVGGRFAAQHRISVGDLVAAVGLAQFLLGPLSAFTMAGARLAQGRASAARVAAVLDAPRHAGSAAAPASRGALEVPGAFAAAPPSPGELEVPGAFAAAPASGGELEVPGAFAAAPPSRGEPEVAGFAVAPGETLGIAADGASALALADLLASAPYDGGVVVDGAEVADLTPDAARRTLLVARHDAPLFAASVQDNVAASAAAPDRVAPALAAADAAQVAATLPDGLATVLTERGASLSGGQRQRVALARALAADPAVLVLHDPTTAVDAATEARMAAGLRDVRADRTTVIIATSPALLAACDRVLLVRDGAVRAEGTHADLAADPAYRDLVLA
ncbi:putative multidrug resistance ABC transporter ATP-binding/permease protein YheI [Actinomadura rubteroloni]|uniref:Putative multidrug resistance ABC transporter ATP-binding/permease protein YheI n=1 Tax=Actinomadura rubteroloni TaxID=1926885 RepID=A0A2P4UNG4_9ACTN|nr:ABC transporter ATP-binding protein [Actinomadura rubteroloni]POM26572.1 putative multidrug resistance ABC transporter ATP-binding/permease protein YheI [Actinomadura rubteroloni]